MNREKKMEIMREDWLDYLNDEDLTKDEQIERELQDAMTASKALITREIENMVMDIGSTFMAVEEGHEWNPGEMYPIEIGECTVSNTGSFTSIRENFLIRNNGLFVVCNGDEDFIFEFFHEAVRFAAYLEKANSVRNNFFLNQGA